jgi:hypothetical protein
MNQFYSRKSQSSSARKIRFRPQLESLEDRVVPSLVPPTGGQWVDVLGNLRIDTNGGNDQFVITDNGRSGVGNVTVKLPAGVTADLTTTNLLRSMNEQLVGRHVNTILWVDADRGDGVAGGTNKITYNATANTPVSQLAYLGTSQKASDHFTANINGLAPNRQCSVIARGGSGDDTLQVHVAGRYQGGSLLSVDMWGQLDWDVVGVDAWSAAPTMDAMSRMKVVLAANTPTSAGLNDTADSGNNVSFWYLGVMNGNLQFDLWGSGGTDPNGLSDWVSANLWLNAGSSGSVGNGTASGPVSRAGQATMTSNTSYGAAPG